MQIYLDHAATTSTDERVLAKMLPFLTNNYGNPSSLYTLGQQAKAAINDARNQIAGLLNSSPEEIIFTGSGTESDNLATIGFALANQQKGKHIITTNIEHHAVMNACEFLATQGFKITYLHANKQGLIDPKQVINAITEQTILVSVAFVNNEIGTVMPILEIAKICKQKNITFHTDAIQAACSYSLDVKKLNVDLLTISGHKIYGPKGIGVLFCRKGIKINPIIHGGGQEFGKRSGTENTANIVGMAEAFSLVQQQKDFETKRLILLRDKLIKGILTTINKTRLNGHPTLRSPNNVNISFLDIEGESLILHLDAKGISASTGSACSSASLEPSHILLAIGLPAEIAHGSLRFTLGKSTTNENIDYVLEVLPEIVAKLRAMSPLNLKVADFPDLFENDLSSR